MPGTLKALGNMAAWVTSLISKTIQPRADTVGRWIDGWDQAGEIQFEARPKEGGFDIRIKLPKREN